MLHRLHEIGFFPYHCQICKLFPLKKGIERGGGVAEGKEERFSEIAREKGRKRKKGDKLFLSKQNSYSVLCGNLYIDIKILRPHA